MAGELNVDHEQLGRHLEAVYGVAWKVQNAAAAAHQVGVGGWSQYGVLSLLFWPTIEQAASALLNDIGNKL